MPVSTAGSTPAPPAVGAATITPMAAFTSCTASARISTSRNSVPLKGPSGPDISFAASPPTRPDAERRSGFSPSVIAPRMITSARDNCARMSAIDRPPSADSASSATVDSETPRDSASRMASARLLYMSGRSHFVEPEGPAHPRQRANRIAHIFARLLIQFDHQERITAPLFS